MDLINFNNNMLVLNREYLPNQMIDEFTGTLSGNTKRAYLNDIKQFFNIKDFRDLSIEMVQSVNTATSNQYFIHLRENGYANSTINRKLQALSKFYKFMSRREVGIVSYNPFSSDEGSVRVKVKKYSSTRCLTDDEVKLFMEVISRDKSIIGLRNKIILLLLATTGLRRTEVATLKIGQMTKNMGHHIIEYVGKGHKEGFVVIADAVKKLIDQYLELRGLTYMNKNEPLFISHSTNGNKNQTITSETVYRAVKSTAKKAGLDADSISPHCFRHTYITKSLELGSSLEDVSDRVFHSDISTTRRYDHTARILKGNPADSLASIYGGI